MRILHKISQMQFDPSIDDFEAVYPDLCSRKGITPDVNLLRFCILIAAPDSPLSEERSFDVKAEMAMSKLNLGPSEAGAVMRHVSEFTEEYQETIYELFRLFHNRKFETWFSMLQALHIMGANLRNPAAMKDTDRLRVVKDLSKINEELDELEFSLFKDDASMRAVMEAAERHSMSGYAELFAQESP